MGHRATICQFQSVSMLNAQLKPWSSTQNIQAFKLLWQLQTNELSPNNPPKQSNNPSLLPKPQQRFSRWGGRWRDRRSRWLRFRRRSVCSQFSLVILLSPRLGPRSWSWAPWHGLGLDFGLGHHQLKQLTPLSLLRALLSRFFWCQLSWRLSRWRWWLRWVPTTAGQRRAAAVGPLVAQNHFGAGLLRWLRWLRKLWLGFRCLAIEESWALAAQTLHLQVDYPLMTLGRVLWCTWQNLQKVENAKVTYDLGLSVSALDSGPRTMN